MKGEVVSKRITVGQLESFLSEVDDKDVEVCLASGDGGAFFPIEKIGISLAVPEATGQFTKFTEEIKTLLPDTERVFYFKVSE